MAASFRFRVDRLIALREAAGLSVNALAARAGVQQKSLHNWEHGNSLPKIDGAAKLARALGVSLDELVAFDEEESED